ncbi:MAG: pyruvate kinase, partial [Anaerolineae bacterium]|nr:pyruvate kinase [Anaerolineae bacterium]
GLDVSLRLLRYHAQAMIVRAIVTAPPYAPYLDEVARHPLVCGLRLNTVMPLRGGPAETLARLARLGQPLWVDLKGRQLRVVGAAIPPYTELRVSHSLRVETPVDAYLSDGAETLRIAAVDGARLILEDGPHRLVGPGESVNILHPSLQIEGTLTETDRAYLAAMAELGLRQVMLSYIEQPADVAEVRELLPDAEVILKVESLAGLAFAQRYGASVGRLMAARGDLYVEVIRPHRIVGALREIIAADPEAVVASRIFDSLDRSPVPSSADIGDVAFLLSLGYRTFMLGDTVCFRRDSVWEALNLLEAVASEFP